MVVFDRCSFAKHLWKILLMVLQGKTIFIFLNHYTEWYVLKAVPQRNSPTKIFCKYAVSLLENTHAKI